MRKYISILILLVLIVPAQTTVNSDLSVQQFGVVLPDIKVNDIIILTENPEEGVAIDVKVKVENNDNFTYTNPIVHIKIEELQLGHPDPTEELEAIIVLNYTIATLEPNTVIDITDQIFANAGQWTMQAYISFNDSVIPSSMFVSVLQVLTPPIGDLNQLLLAWELILGTLIIVIFLPSIIDKFRRFKIKK